MEIAATVSKLNIYMVNRGCLILLRTCFRADTGLTLWFKSRCTTFCMKPIATGTSECRLFSHRLRPRSVFHAVHSVFLRKIVDFRRCNLLDLQAREQLGSACRVARKSKSTVGFGQKSFKLMAGYASAINTLHTMEGPGAEVR